MTVAAVLETCLYATDLSAAERFYADVVGLEVYARVERRHVFFRCGRGMFLVFNPQVTALGMRVGTDESKLQHGATGPGHVAFEVSEPSLPQWRAKLTDAAVAIEAEVTWPRGGRSIYVRDPAGNSVEFATPEVWGRTETPAL